MRPTIEQSRTKELRIHLPNVLAAIVVEYADRQLYKREATIFAKKERDHKKLDYYLSQEYSDDVDAAIEEFMTTYI
jgi:hypothetical protein